MNERQPLSLSELDQKQVDDYTQMLLSLIQNGSYEFDLEYEDVQSCVKHLLYVLQLNKIINLTRITQFPDALVLHILDSLLFISLMPDTFSFALDMGTGPGFPGIPLARAKGGTWTLLDSVKKKVFAISLVCNELELQNCVPVHARLEDFARQQKAQFDVVTARALAPLPVLLEYARPFLKIGGKLIVSKGIPEQDELESAYKVVQVLGFSSVYSKEFNLPLGLGHRTLLSFKVIDDSSVSLPRITGLARKKPLA
ncbi:16S rRNA (guanine(527)-N(7))-methyltransferase RsmG [Collinsella sp. AGMB00827]|uniref:Ribosomal RNA small subunit methyltransferase G n=1 Tax=Collinsella ureilytica TaxID=2869515 RepID=A0ABS7MKI9_9ACTN|nr:16S rRNA (guanine(527)-N(7))-methyltransferase RsmG [Collinsella urealyticum]MBY4797807.1 16S rRNA (guanine(527)-N(7))-methyltransferase RsmG [Collinsella urealyticum]